MMVENRKSSNFLKAQKFQGVHLYILERVDLVLFENHLVSLKAIQM